MDFHLRFCKGRFGALILAGLACWAVPAPRVSADTVVLTNGRKVIGVIEDASSDEQQLTVRTAQTTMRIPRNKIQSVERQDQTSYSETNGDLAVADNDLDRGLLLYNNALEADPNNQGLQAKIKAVRERIQERDKKSYGQFFSKITDLIEAQQYGPAIEEARMLRDRVQEDSVRTRANELIAAAHVGQARAYRDKVDYPSAEKQYRLAMEADPNGPLAALELADMLQANPSRKSDAIPFYEKGIELARNNPGTLDEDLLMAYRYKIGKLLNDDGQFSEAAEIFLDVARTDRNFKYPQSVDMAVDAYSRVQTGSYEGDLEHLIQNLQTIIDLRPNESRAYMLLGRIYFDRKEWERARELLEKALEDQGEGELSRSSMEAMYYLGIAQRRLEDDDAAAKTFERLVAQRTVNYETLCELGEVHFKLGNYEKALAQFDRALQIDPDKYRAYLGRGYTLTKSIDPEKNAPRYAEARVAFNEVVTRDKSNASAQLAIAQSYSLEGKWDEAAVEASKAIELLQSQLPTSEAAAPAGEGTPPAGEGAAPAAEGAAPTAEQGQMMAEAYTLMGTSSQKQRKSNLARDQFESAFKFVPDYPPALNGIGHTYEDDGHHEQAQEVFNKAIQVDPENPEYYLSMGVNWHQFRKNTQEALKYYLKYVELGGKDPNVRIWIAECGGTPPAA